MDRAERSDQKGTLFSSGTAFCLVSQNKFYSNVSSLLFWYVLHLVTDPLARALELARMLVIIQRDIVFIGLSEALS